jgi:hypothetical protein
MRGREKSYDTLLMIEFGISWGIDIGVWWMGRCTMVWEEDIQ